MVATATIATHTNSHAPVLDESLGPIWCWNRGGKLNVWEWVCDYVGLWLFCAPPLENGILVGRDYSLYLYGLNAYIESTQKG